MWIGKARSGCYSAKCKWCFKGFGFSYMGECFLKSHMKSKKYVVKAPVNHPCLVKNHFSIQKENTEPVLVEQGQPEPKFSLLASPNSKQPTMSGLISKENCPRTEICWALKAIESKQHSCDRISNLLQEKFPGSKIAKTFQLLRPKCSYC